MACLINLLNNGVYGVDGVNGVFDNLAPKKNLLSDLGNTFFLLATQKTEKLVDYAMMRNCLQKRELCLLNHPENEVRAAAAKQRKSLFNQQRNP